MKNISEVKNCYGCLACIDRCPVNCISESKTSLGHLIPSVDEEVCIACGACLKVCPDIVDNNLTSPLITIAAWDNNKENREKSSSGAIAALLSEMIVKNGGIVYGCAFVSPFEFRHIRCDSIESLEQLRGSKYVQSHLLGIFKDIRKDINTGVTVLFIGTPCQCAAVKNYIGSKSNLLTIDLVCHGVPSLQILKDSLPASVFSKHITTVEFRACTKYHFSLKSGISTIFDRPINNDLYLKAFFTGLDYRSSCYECSFACGKRVGDITLGDFWGLKLDIPEVEKSKGVSLCLINTSNGKKMIDSIKDHTFQAVRSVQEAIDGNHQLRHPKKKTIRASLFRRLYPKIGFKWSVILSIPDIYIKNKILK